MSTKLALAQLHEAKRQAETLDRYCITTTIPHATTLWRWDRLGWRVVAMFASERAAIDHLMRKLDPIPSTKGDIERV